MHQNQQVILSLLFYQASHEGRIYSLPNLQKSRRVTVSRPVCVDVQPCRAVEKISVRSKDGTRAWSGANY